MCTEVDLSVRTMGQVPRLFQWAEKSPNQSEMGFNNPVVTVGQSLPRRTGLQDWVLTTLGVDNIERSTSMSTLVSNNAGAISRFQPNVQRGIGSSWRQQEQKSFPRGRRAPFESGKVSRVHQAQDGMGDIPRGG